MLDKSIKNKTLREDELDFMLSINLEILENAQPLDCNFIKSPAQLTLMMPCFIHLMFCFRVPALCHPWFIFKFLTTFLKQYKVHLSFTKIQVWFYCLANSVTQFLLNFCFSYNRSACCDIPPAEEAVSIREKL